MFTDNDTRYVVHYNLPGSLEAYLQEAGRAGRDRRPSDCVLLFDADDAERQFRLAAGSRLGRRDMRELLATIRRAARASSDGVVAVTTGDLLRPGQYKVMAPGECPGV